MSYLRKPWVIALLSSLASLAAVFVLYSVLQGQEDNATKIDRTQDRVVVTQRKVEGPDSTLSKTVRRLSRALRKLDRTVRRLNAETAQQDALIRDLRAAGAKLPSVVRGEPGPPGLPGATGRPGASATPAQIATAVARYCRANRCGVPPTTQQVNDAIRTCSAAGGCRGPQGPPGAMGKDGRDGKDAVSPPSQPMVPCPMADPALRYQCQPVPDTPPPPPPPVLP